MDMYQERTITPNDRADAGEVDEPRPNNTRQNAPTTFPSTLDNPIRRTQYEVATQEPSVKRSVSISTDKAKAQQPPSKNMHIESQPSALPASLHTNMPIRVNPITLPVGTIFNYQTYDVVTDPDEYDKLWSLYQDNKLPNNIQNFDTQYFRPVVQTTRSAINALKSADSVSALNLYTFLGDGLKHISKQERKFYVPFLHPKRAKGMFRDDGPRGPLLAAVMYDHGRPPSDVYLGATVPTTVQSGGVWVVGMLTPGSVDVMDRIWRDNVVIKRHAATEEEHEAENEDDKVQRERRDPSTDEYLPSTNVAPVASSEKSRTTPATDTSDQQDSAVETDRDKAKHNNIHHSGGRSLLNTTINNKNDGNHHNTDSEGSDKNKSNTERGAEKTKDQHGATDPTHQGALYLADASYTNSGEKIYTPVFFNLRPSLGRRS